MATETKCDRCGTVIWTGRSTLKTTLTRHWLRSWERDNEYDLCKQCAADFDEWMHAQPADEGAET
jgi:hypothetical protein